MAYTVRLRPEAVDDVDRALAYYASIRIDLLIQLHAEFDHFFDRLASDRSPCRFTLVRFAVSS